MFGGCPLIQYFINYYHHMLCAQKGGEARADYKSTKRVKEVHILYSGSSQNILAAL